MKLILLVLSVLILKVLTNDIFCTDYGDLVNETTMILLKNEGCNVITGNLTIATSVTSLENLTNVVKIAGDLSIIENSMLDSLFGLDNLVMVNGSVFIHKTKVTSIPDMNKLTSVTGQLSVALNDLLTSISGFNNLFSVGSSLTVSGNSNLNSISGFNNLDAARHVTFWKNADSLCNDVCSRNVMAQITNKSTSGSSTNGCRQGFVCPNDPDVNEELTIFNCKYGTKCLYCRQSTCEYEYIYRHCGDGRKDGFSGEQCDDGNTTSHLLTCQNDEPTCTYCDAQCQRYYAKASICGDGIVDPKKGEECDNKNVPLNSTKCEYGDMMCQFCDSSCKLIEGNKSFCGDGIVDEMEGEECDNTDTMCDAQCKLIPESSSDLTSSNHTSQNSDLTSSNHTSQLVTNSVGTPSENDSNSSVLKLTFYQSLYLTIFCFVTLAKFSEVKK